MTVKGRGNAGLWTARKTKNRFPIAAHEPLEIAVAISTFPRPRPRVSPINQIKNERRINPTPKSCPSGSSQDWNVLSGLKRYPMRATFEGICSCGQSARVRRWIQSLLRRA